jgi:hypothetical protein
LENAGVPCQTILQKQYHLTHQYPQQRIPTKKIGIYDINSSLDDDDGGNSLLFDIPNMLMPDCNFIDSVKNIYEVGDDDDDDDNTDNNKKKSTHLLEAEKLFIKSVGNTSLIYSQKSGGGKPFQKNGKPLKVWIHLINRNKKIYKKSTNVELMEEGGYDYGLYSTFQRDLFDKNPKLLSDYLTSNVKVLKKESSYVTRTKDKVMRFYTDSNYYPQHITRAMMFYMITVLYKYFNMNNIQSIQATISMDQLTVLYQTLNSYLPANIATDLKEQSLLFSRVSRNDRKKSLHVAKLVDSLLNNNEKVMEMTNSFFAMKNVLCLHTANLSNCVKYKCLSHEKINDYHSKELANINNWSKYI